MGPQKWAYRRVVERVQIETYKIRKYILINSQRKLKLHMTYVPQSELINQLGGSYAKTGGFEMSTDDLT